MNTTALWRPNVRDNNDNTYAPWNHSRVLSGRLDNRRNPYQAIPPLDLKPFQSQVQCEDT